MNKDFGCTKCGKEFDTLDEYWTHDSDCVRDPMQRSCLAAQPEDEPVTDEPPHLADRRLAGIKKGLDSHLRLANEMKGKLAANSAPWLVADGIVKGLEFALEVYEQEGAPAAEAREERPSGRPNGGARLPEAEEGAN